MILSILFFPLLLAAGVLVLRSNGFSQYSLVGSALLYMVATVSWFAGAPRGWLPGWLSAYFAVDGLGLLFFAIMSVVYLSAAVYSLFYFREHGLDAANVSLYAGGMLLFVWAMGAVILATHLALLWVFVEATTLTSAVLIYFEKKKSSLEAAWKYVFICSVGIALAFVGIILLSLGSSSVHSLFFADLYRGAGSLDPFWLKMAFAFIIIGFGTKIGVAPLHAWLPDAHSEAPSPVSALLSGTLLNTTFLGLIRVHKLMTVSHLEHFANGLLLIFGILSLIISATFMVRLANYKRMLAYSSIENMGMLFIGLALGGIGIYGALLHSIAHSLSKAALFLTSGNILHRYHTKKINGVQGLLQRDKATGWLWIFSFLAIAGAPPFPAFLSKFLIVSACFQRGVPWLGVPFFIFIIVIIYGMGGAVFSMSFGKKASSEIEPSRLGLCAYAPQIVLLLILLLMGISIPEPVHSALQSATSFLQF